MKGHLKHNTFIYFASSIIYQKQKYLMSKLKNKDFKKSKVDNKYGMDIVYYFNNNTPSVLILLSTDKKHTY